MADDRSEDEQPFSLRPIALSAFGPSVVISLGEGAMLPVLALRARELGASVGTAAFIVALVGLGTVAAALPAGSLVARFGERRALFGAAVVAGVAMVVGAVAGTIWLFGAVAFTVGASGAVFNLARQAYLTDAVPVGRRARALSTLGGVIRIGLFVGPFVGALAVSRSGIPAAFVVAAAATLVGAVLVLVLPDLPVHAPAPAARGPRASVWSVIRDQRHVLLTLGTGALVVAGARACRTSVLPLWAESVGTSPSATAVVFGIAGAVDMLLFYPAGYVMDRWGRVWVAVGTVVLIGVGMLVLPLTSALPAITAVAVLMAVGNGIGSGIVMTLGADVAPPQVRPQFLGGWRLFADSGAAAGPLVVSGIAVIAPLGLAIAVVGALSVLGGGWLAHWVPRFDPRAGAGG